jgi:hypothetical protein
LFYGAGRTQKLELIVSKIKMFENGRLPFKACPYHNTILKSASSKMRDFLTPLVVPSLPSDGE